ncbi:ABC transporter ATP-binding protein [Kibdelosporangium phytohabitans]|uniref:Multidrug ABC transporter permease n=1 Tax=Kibdelosporangium phytohabitans TaxID=860235 RepID=A0A0N9I2D6_9PSEU|nr:ABC transporter ATP-binding protein [Kibdelosporangium phytohabitans]ALG08603.1 multidrug ABC transporter permease [Kibdelosporangium phytohabitans]MBE1470313.1 ATP-binding cassette subfamily C protein [Kibdelosporangium phytohabitans]
MSDLLPVSTPKQTWAMLRAQLLRQRRLSSAALLVMLAASGAGLVAPWMIGVLVDDVTAGAGTNRIVGIVAVLVGAALVAGMLVGIGTALVARVGETVLARVRERVLDRALHLPSSTLEEVGIGDLLSRAGDDVSVVTRAITQTVPDLVQAVFTIALTGAGLFALDWRLGLAGLAAVPMYVVSLRWYLPRSGPYYAKERIAIGERTQALASSLRGKATVRAYRLEDTHIDRLTDRSASAMNLSLDVFRLFTRFASRNNRAEFVGLTAVLVVGFLLVRGDMTSVGAVTAAALYFHRLFNPVGFLIMEFDEIQSAGASMARLAGVAALDPPAGPANPREPATASLEVQGITHHYDGPAVLHDVSVRLEPGERVALVGASGAGKTTLAGIAAGVLAPVDGVVKLGGFDLADIGEARVRRHIALLSQEVHVFDGTLLDDVRLARDDASDAEVLAALDVVGATGWVNALPDGPATQVGEGAHELTAAQAQQLALARLVLADPMVAVLDEATAEAGSAGARVLEEAADAATRGRTTLVVAHRLTQAERADRVLVLDKGVVVESGSHDELLAAGGRYADLWWSWTGIRGVRNFGRH